MDNAEKIEADINRLHLLLDAVDNGDNDLILKVANSINDNHTGYFTSLGLSLDIANGDAHVMRWVIGEPANSLGRILYSNEMSGHMCCESSIAPPMTSHYMTFNGSTSIPAPKENNNG